MKAFIITIYFKCMVYPIVDVKSHYIRTEEEVAKNGIK